MNNYLAVLKIIEIIEAVVQTVERAANLKGGMTGSEKLDAAIAMLGNIFENLQKYGGIKEISGVQWVNLVPIVKIIINAMVSLYNNIGTFFRSPVEVVVGSSK